MKCAKCNSQVSISDSKCPKCGHDLLQFGATEFYEPTTGDSGRNRQDVKDMAFGTVSREIRNNMKALDSNEMKILSPIENRFKNLFKRHLSDEEFDHVFNSEIIPTLAALRRDNSAEKSLKKIEETIRSKIGDNIFQLYENPDLKVKYKDRNGKLKIVTGNNILDILRVGEIIFDNITTACAGLTDVDFSAGMFSFFKASEVACLLHSHDRYDGLKDSPEIKKFTNWLGNDVEDVYIERIPPWLGRRKKTLFDTVRGIYAGNRDNINGCLRTGISIFVIGRNWVMELKRKDSSELETYQLKNYMNALGKSEDKESLAESLSRLQALRNPRVHGGVEKDKNKMDESRELSYNCLKGIYKILEI